MCKKIFFLHRCDEHESIYIYSIWGATKKKIDRILDRANKYWFEFN